ncbi:MAG TPA: tetratricopeptide repeat protein [Blastocatellia bacterium]|nr:tetratricopeptide repeat protein [Blastocatellia bacterium]
MRALLKVLLGIVPVLLMLLCMTACVHTAADYVKQGNSFFAKEKYQDASISYRNAIKKDPKNGEAYYRLGLVAIKLGHIGDAIPVLFQALELQPNNQDARFKISDIYLNTYLLDASHPQFLYAKLTTLSDEFLAKNPSSFQGLRLKGYLALSDRKPAEAAGYFKRAYEIKSTDEGVASSWIEALFMGGQSQEGEALALKMVKDHPDFGSVYDRLAQHYTSLGRSAEAESLLKTKVAANPSNIQYALQLAGFYIHANRAADAQTVLKRILDDPKDFPNARLQVGDFYYDLHDWQKAGSYYQEGLRSDSKNALAYQERLTDAFLGQGNRADATQMVDTILKANHDNADARRVHASLLATSSDPADIAKAISEFESLVKDYPGNADFSYRLGRVYLSKGDLDAARTSFEQALKVRGDFLLPRYPLARINLEQGHPNIAIRYASEILVARPNDPQAMLVHASALMDRGDNALARQELTTLLRQSPEDVDAQVQLGLLDIKERKFKEAAKLFEDVRRSHKDDPRVVAGLAEAVAAQNRVDEAFQILYSAGSAVSVSPALHEELARVAVRGHKYDVAIREYSQLATQNPKSLELTLRLAEVYQLNGNLKSAVQAFQNATKLAPGNPTPYLLLGDALWKSNRIQEASQAYHRAVAVQPDSLPAMNNLAFFLAETCANLDEALRVSQRAVQQAPQQPSFKDTLGWVYLKRNDTSSALQIFNSLVRQYPNDPLFRYHLGVSLFRIGEKAKARTELATALSKRPQQADEVKIKEIMAKIN